MRKPNKKKDIRFKDKEKKDKKKGKDSDKYSGLNTIAQVTGQPKSHSFHSSIPVAATKTVKEPLLTCPDCGERIQSIAESFLTASGEYVHFDCMLNRIKSSENLKEGESISYIGRGNFAVVEKDEEGKYHINKTINVEDEKSYNAAKEYVESLKV